MKQSTRVGVLIKAGFYGFAVAGLATPSVHAAIAWSHVISNTGTRMIDTVYDAQGHVHQINTFPNTAPTPSFTRTSYRPPPIATRN